MKDVKEKAIVEAFNKGYKIINGEVHYKGKIIKMCKDGKGYYFGIRNVVGKRINIKVDRLLCYELFGDKIFNRELELYHKDDDIFNNAEDNISLRHISERPN